MWMSRCYPVTMDRHTIKPTTVRLELQDKQAIETIKHLYGCPSDVAAIRLALRMVAEAQVIPTRATPNKERPLYPRG
jgi:Arc/MetJ family transcription regulator